MPFLLLLACEAPAVHAESGTDAPTETGCEATPWFLDEDGDGFGGSAAGTACEPLGGTVAVDGDCNDADAEVHPGALDVCDGRDNDCDAETLETGVALDGVPGFATISEALAVAGEGSEVTVCAGTYPESLTIGTTLTLRGPAGAAATVIDAGGSGAVVTVTGGSPVLEGVTLTGGAAGGIDASAAGGLTLVACDVTGNEGVSGAGVLGPISGPLSIIGGTISGNEASEYGGGVYAANLTIDGAVVHANEALDGAGIFVPDGGVAVLSAATVSSNEAASIGGGAYIGLGATLTTDATRWDGDRAAVYAAGVYLDEGSSFSDTAGTFDNLAAEDKGGAIYARYADVALAGSTFTGNSGTWGGHVFLYGATLTAETSTFRYGVAELGGAMYVYAGSAATLTDCIVEGNTAGSSGGVRLRTDAVFTSVATAWGSGASDNLPNDVDVSNNALFWYTDAASFTCSTDTATCETVDAAAMLDQ